MTFFWRRNVRVRRSTIPGADRGVRGGCPGFSSRAQQSGGWHPNSCSSQGAARRPIRADRSGARANRCWTGSWTRGRAHHLNYWTRGRDTPPELPNKGTRHTIWTTEQEDEAHRLNYWTRGRDTPPELLNKTTRHTTWTTEQEGEAHHLNYRIRGRGTLPELPNKRTRYTAWTTEQEDETHHLK